MPNGDKDASLFDPAPEIELDNEKENDRANDKAVSERVLKTYRSLGYDRYEVISAWIKEMRRGDAEGSVYWARIMLEAGDLGRGNAEVGYMCKRLQIFATEDLCPMEDWAVSYASGMSKCAHETHAVLWFTFRMALAKKWWETEPGLFLRSLTVKLKSEIHSWSRGKVFDWPTGRWREAKPEEVSKKRPIPSYAVDIHCWRGKELNRKQLPMDERWSGNGVGIAERIFQGRANGKDPAGWKPPLFTCSWNAGDESNWFGSEAQQGRDGQHPAKQSDLKDQLKREPVPTPSRKKAEKANGKKADEKKEEEKK